MNNPNLNRDSDITLKEYVNDKFEDLEKSIDIRFSTLALSINSALASADKAISKSDIAIEKRLDSVNEFRATLSDQQRTLMPRAEVEILMKSMNEKIDSLTLLSSAKQSKDIGTKEGMGFIIGIASLVSIIVGVLIKFIN